MALFCTFRPVKQPSGRCARSSWISNLRRTTWFQAEIRQQQISPTVITAFVKVEFKWLHFGLFAKTGICYLHANRVIPRKETKNPPCIILISLWRCVKIMSFCTSQRTSFLQPSLKRALPSILTKPAAPVLLSATCTCTSCIRGGTYRSKYSIFIVKDQRQPRCCEKRPLCTR